MEFIFGMVIGFYKKSRLFPPLTILFFAGITSLALFGLMGAASQIDARGENRTNLDLVIGGLHLGNNYGRFL
jgi:hypothetical protein